MSLLLQQLGFLGQRKRILGYTGKRTPKTSERLYIPPGNNSPDPPGGGGVLLILGGSAR